MDVWVLCNSLNHLFHLGLYYTDCVVYVIMRSKWDGQTFVVFKIASDGFKCLMSSLDLQ